MNKYNNYKDSGVEWLGVIPDHWEAKRIKYYIDNEQNGVWGDEAKGNENDIVCLRVADFDRDHLITRLCDTSTIRNLEINKFQSRILKHNDLMIEKSGGGDNQLVGFVTRYINNAPVICSNFVAKLSLFNHVDAKYTTYLFSSLYSNKINYKSIKQTSGIQNIDTTQYFNEVAPFPPLIEQQQIADYLDLQTAKIDELIQKQKKLIELLQEKKKSLINNVVTKGIRPQAVMFDTNVFNNLLDNIDLLEKLPKDIKYYITHIQCDEIMATADSKRKKSLLDVFENLSDQCLPTKGWGLGVSRLGGFMLGSTEDSQEIKHISNDKSKHIKDALILLTAKYNNITVISDDMGTPFKRAKRSDYNVMNLSDFITKYALKDSGIEWLGQIPKHWQVKKLKYLAQIRDVKQQYNLDYGYIGLENIESWTGNFLHSKEEQHIDGLANLCFAGDVLFGKLRPYLAKCMISSKQNFCSTEILVLKPVQLISQLLQYDMLSENFINDINSSTYGTKMPRASWEYISNLKLSVPQSEEQQAIVNYLNKHTMTINKLINKAKSMVELLKEHKQSLINHVVTGKIKVIENII